MSSELLLADPVRMTVIHKLKTDPVPFAAISVGNKRFEMRTADRQFNVGDDLWLQEFDRETQTFTGSVLIAAVTYVMRAHEYGVPDGYVVMSIDVVANRIAIDGSYREDT